MIDFTVLLWISLLLMVILIIMFLFGIICSQPISFSCPKCRERFYSISALHQHLDEETTADVRLVYDDIERDVYNARV